MKDELNIVDSSMKNSNMNFISIIVKEWPKTRIHIWIEPKIIFDHIFICNTYSRQTYIIAYNNIIIEWFGMVGHSLMIYIQIFFDKRNFEYSFITSYI